MQLHFSSLNQGLGPVWWLLLVPLISAALKKETGVGGKIIFLIRFCYLGLRFFSTGLLAQEGKANQSGEWQGDLLKPKQSHRTPPRLTGCQCSFLSEHDCACLCWAPGKDFHCFPFYLLSRKMVFLFLSISGCEALGMLGRVLPSLPRQQWWFPPQPRAAGCAQLRGSVAPGTSHQEKMPPNRANSPLGTDRVSSEMTLCSAKRVQLG